MSDPFDFNISDADTTGTPRAPKIDTIDVGEISVAGDSVPVVPVGVKGLSTLTPKLTSVEHPY